MRKLFETSEINGMKLANRFVRSATWEGMATDDGACTPKLIDLMVNLARGGMGLIISGHSYVSPEGQAGPWQLGVYQDELISGLSEMTQAVHDNGGKIIMQLAHAGLTANAKLTGITPIGPSPLEDPKESPGQEMTDSDIARVVSAFAAGAKRAQTAGFDGVQIHGAHGYLLSQFLSPYFNRRQDQYGGSIENRARIVLEVLRAIRGVVGNEYPVLIKLNCQDFHDNGLSQEDAVQAGMMLAEEGIDAIELSGGNPMSGKLGPVRAGIKSEAKEAYFQKEARAFRDNVAVPLILVGGNRSFQVAQYMINENVADYISMSRPLVREPDLVNRWKGGDHQRSACVSDNMCFKPVLKGDGIYCLTEEREKIKTIEKPFKRII
jgi:2,4-dienoyl-CoA reductase-like NADH-dependent reductase (Old Yellow Enzyme family)